MTRINFDRVQKRLISELKEIVTSYFSPITAAVKGVRWLLEQTSRHFRATGESISEKPPARH
jgi:hypothetical protein